jgi:glutathione S-transferase
MIELYHAGLSTCSKKVRLCLKEKGIDYVSHYVDTSRFEHHHPDYLALNPNGLVPTLVHNGVVVIESSIINEYIEDAFPETPLRPADPGKRAHMRLWSRFSDEAATLSYAFTLASGNGFANALRGLDEAELEARLEQFPLPERRAAVAKALLEGGASDAELESSRARAVAIVTQAEQDLAKAPYLAGDDYSLADVNMIAHIERFRDRILPGRFTPQTYPRTFEWFGRIMDRPKVKEAFANSAETRPTPPTSVSA